MADKLYKITFEMSDGTEKYVEFTAPQGEQGENGSIMLPAPASALVSSGMIDKSAVDIPSEYTPKVGDYVLLDNCDLHLIHDIDESYFHVIWSANIRGEQGTTGADGKSVLIAPASSLYNDGTYLYIDRSSLTTANGRIPSVGDLVLLGSGDMYRISSETYVSIDGVSRAVFRVAYFANIKGAAGSNGKDGQDGKDGKDGYTPVKGTDYFTEADKAEMVETVKTSMDGIPSYWQEHLDEKIALIRETMLSIGANKSAFFFYSDSHWSNATTYTAKMAPTLLKYLCKNTPINKTNFGGDIVSAEAEDAETMAYLWEWRNQLYGLPNHHSVPGNHDDGNATNNLFSEQYVYGYLQAPEESCDVVRGDEGMYYYIDNHTEKTRYLYLDTAYKGVTANEQAFVKSALLSTPENWHIVVISHLWYSNTYGSNNVVTLNGFDTNAKKLLDVFDKFNARSGEYAECTAWVEFCIGGHWHNDYVSHTDGGIPVIIVEADAIHNRNGTVATHGTITESAVSAVIADYNTKTIDVIRIGRGADYETTINVSKIAYTNVIPLSIDSTGAIFNGGKGWADKSRIGSGKLESYIGGSTYFTTGHIEIDPTIDNTIRLRNITFDSTTTISNIGIAFYDASFARVAPLSTSSNNFTLPSAIGNATNGYAPVLDGTNIVQFTFKNGAHIDNTAVKYIALCTEYIGDDSIITINEEIE